MTAKRRAVSAAERTTDPWRNRIVGQGDEAPDQLLANPSNWRIHPTAQREALAAVLDDVGWVQRVIVNRTSQHVVDGHLRVALAISRDEPIIPVSYVELDAREEALVLASLDPLAAMAVTDKDKLRELLEQAQVTDDSLRASIASATGLPIDVSTQEKDLDRLPDLRPTEIASGDVFTLGAHRLVCGDSTSAHDVALLMRNDRADLCFTSPPYGQQRDYQKSIENWAKLMSGVFRLLPNSCSGSAQVLVNLGLVHRNNEWHPYWQPWLDAMSEFGWRRFGLYVWDQGAGLPGDWAGRFAPSFELIFHFNKETKKPEKWVPKLADTIRTNKNRTFRNADGSLTAFTNPTSSTQPHKIPDSVIRVNRQVGSDGHPAQFSVGLAGAILRSWTGDVFEPFAGSGTTLIAAQELDRRCFAMELEPSYCQIIVDRWEAFTGQKAKKVQP